MSKPKVFDDEMSAALGGSGRIHDDPGGWTDGDVLTFYGIVAVYTQGDDRYDRHTRLDFVWKGRLHIRNISNRRYTARGLVTLAKRFAAEIAEDHK